MITTRFRIILIILAICYFVVIIHLLKREHVILKYALFWLLGGLLFAVCAVFPSVIKLLCGIIGVYSDANFMFFLLIGILFILSGTLTVIVSRLSNTNTRLTQKMALLEEDLHQLKKSLGEQ